MPSERQRSRVSFRQDLPSRLALYLRNELDGSRDVSARQDLSQYYSKFCDTTKQKCIIQSTNELKKKDIGLFIGRACGEDLKGNLTSFIRDREQGHNFQLEKRIKIGNNFLPNSAKTICVCNKKILCGRFSNDGNSLITSVYGKSIFIYRIKNGRYDSYKKFFKLPQVEKCITDTTFSPDGDYFAYTHWSNTVNIHPTNEDRNESRIQSITLNSRDSSFCARSLAFSNDGRELLTCGNDACFYMLDRETSKCTRIKGHSHEITSVTFADDSHRIIYTASDDGFCKIWDRRLLDPNYSRPCGVLAGHAGGITYLEAKRDDRHIITNSKDQSIKLWDVRVLSKEDDLPEARKAVRDNATSWDFRSELVPDYYLKNVKPLDNDVSIMTYRGHIVAKSRMQCKFSPLAMTGQKFIYTGCATGRILIYDLLTGKVMERLTGHAGVIADVSWHPFNQEIVSVSWDGKMKLWRYDDCYDEKLLMKQELIRQMIAESS